MRIKLVNLYMLCVFLINSLGMHGQQKFRFSNGEPNGEIGLSSGYVLVSKLDIYLDNITLKKIDSVSIYMNESCDECIVRLHLYDVTSENTPGKSLLKKDIHAEKKHIKNKILYFDLSSQEIVISSETVFIGLEFIHSAKKEYRNPTIPVSKDYDNVAYYRKIHQPSTPWKTFSKADLCVSLTLQ